MPEETIEDPVVEDPPAEDPAPAPQEYNPEHVYPADPILSLYLTGMLRYKADRVLAVEEGLLTQPIACTVLFDADEQFCSLTLKITGPTIQASLIYDHIDQSIIFRIGHANYRIVSADIDKVRRTYSEIRYLINRFVRENDIVSVTAWPKTEDATLESQLIEV